ncbi:MAG: hypothetical protein ACO20H_07290 [Bacteriovoracaceae bacterium]
MAQIEQAQDNASQGEIDGTVNIRTFKKTPEVEGFYRFVYDNNLQKEARLILEKIYTDFLNQKAPKKRRRSKKTQ